MTERDLVHMRLVQTLREEQWAHGKTQQALVDAHVQLARTRDRLEAVEKELAELRERFNSYMRMDNHIFA